jgi:hypothetical protein
MFALEKHGFERTFQGWRHKHLLVSVIEANGQCRLCWSHTEFSPWKHGSRVIGSMQEFDQCLKDLVDTPAAD